MKELAFFLFIKYSYRNSCVFNFSVKSLAEKTGYSRTKVKRHTDIFLENGWCEFHGDNLIFNKYSKFIQYKHTTRFSCKLTVQDILDQLYLYLLQNKKSQCDFAGKVRDDLKNPKCLSDYKRARKNRHRVNIKSASSDNFSLSSIGASRLFCCSPTHAGKILRRLELRFLIKMKRTREVIMKCCFDMAKENMRKGMFWAKGYLIKVLPNIITFGSLNG